MSGKLSLGDFKQLITEILNGTVDQIHSGCLYLDYLHCNNIADTIQTSSHKCIETFKHPQLFLMTWFLKPDGKLKPLLFPHCP